MKKFYLKTKIQIKDNSEIKEIKQMLGKDKFLMDMYNNVLSTTCHLFHTSNGVVSNQVCVFTNEGTDQEKDRPICSIGTGFRVLFKINEDCQSNIIEKLGLLPDFIENAKKNENIVSQDEIRNYLNENLKDGEDLVEILNKYLINQECIVEYDRVGYYKGYNQIKRFYSGVMIQPFTIV